MYLPPDFVEVDAKEILRLIEKFPLASVVCRHNDEFVVNHIPLLFVGESTLIGHIARANTLHQLFPDGADAVAIFNAEDSYISPNWYPTKELTHRHVPTWNYQVVHLHGRMNFDYSKKSKLSAVGKLTKTFETMYFGDKAWKMSDAPEDYLHGLLDHIVSLTFEVETISAKTKVSQNREEVDYKAVEQAMRDTNKTGLADTMKRVSKFRTK